MPESSTKKALVVEDESSIRNVCKRVLSGINFQVSTVEDGKLAEESIVDNFYDLILCDIRLPEVSGIDFYIYLQQEYPAQARKVIFMTGSVMSSDTATFLERSGRPYILKPFRPSELLEVINNSAD